MLRNITFKYGLLTITVDHLHSFNGVWYYYRRVKKDLEPILKKKFEKVSLRTKDKAEAIKRLKAVHKETEAKWASLLKSVGVTTDTRDSVEEAEAFLRAYGLTPGNSSEPVGNGVLSAGEYLHIILSDIYGTELDYALHSGSDDKSISDEERRDLAEAATKKLLKPLHLNALKLLHSKEPMPIFLSAAKDLYISDKGKGKKADFKKQLEVAVTQFLNLFGDLPLADIKRHHANSYRDALLAKGNKTATVRKRLGAVSRIIHYTIKHYSLAKEIENYFSEMDIPNEGEDAKEREVFTDDELTLLAMACRSQVPNTDIAERYRILAMLMDTGARLSEILGLLSSDVFLDDPVPYTIIHEEEEGRSLKTKGSTRVVPLVGIALWAAREQRKANPNGKWFFPIYASDKGGIKSNSADAVLNNYTRKSTKADLTCHCLRHTMADRLREITTEEAILLAIGGWGRKTVSRRYGKGFMVKKLAPIMLQLKEY